MIMEKQFESSKLAKATKKMVVYPLNVEWVKYILIACSYLEKVLLFT